MRATPLGPSDQTKQGEASTVRAVAKKAGVSAPSIYLHFADKAKPVRAALPDEYEQAADRTRLADEDARTR